MARGDTPWDHVPALSMGGFSKRRMGACNAADYAAAGAWGPWLSLLLSERARYGTRTQNLSHDSPHTSGTADAAGVATVHYHPGRAGAPQPDSVTAGGWRPDLHDCHHGRDQPALCL
jgi:hypothetical protein